MLTPNRDAMRETTTQKTLYRSNSPVIRSAGNMSELDSLLQDLSSNTKFSSSQQQHLQHQHSHPQSPINRGIANNRFIIINFSRI